MSPNHPQKYPNILQKTGRIEVETGKVLRLEFTFFELQWDALCAKDYVKIKDGDGTTLMENSCGWMQGVSDSHRYNFKPPILVSQTNSVEILFITNSYSQYKGWKLSWTAVTPGLFLFDHLWTISLIRPSFCPRSYHQQS